MVFYFLLICIFLLWIISLFIFNKDILSPSVVTNTVFLISGFCVLFNYSYWNVVYNLQAALIIILGLILIILVELLVKSFKNKLNYRKNKNRKINIIIIPKYLLLIINVVLIVLFSIYIITTIKLGLSIGATGFLIFGAVKESTEVSISGFPLICYDLCYFTGFVFIYLFLNNVIKIKNGIRKNLFLLIPIIIGIFSVLAMGARGPIMQYLVCFIFLLVSLYRRRYRISINIKRSIFFKIILSTFIFLILFYGVREIVKGRTNSSSFLQYITYYMGSPLYLFSSFIKNTSSVYSGYSYFGVATFTNFYGSLYDWGLVDFPVSTLNFLSINGGISGGNEFTIFMRPYYDFGLIGMLIFLFLFYSMFNFFYYFKLKDQTKLDDSGLLIYSMYFYMVVMSFYYCFTCQDFRLQTIIIIIYVVLLYKFILKVSTKIKIYDLRSMNEKLYL